MTKSTITMYAGIVFGLVLLVFGLWPTIGGGEVNWNLIAASGTVAGLGGLTKIAAGFMKKASIFFLLCLPLIGCANVSTPYGSYTRWGDQQIDSFSVEVSPDGVAKLQLEGQKSAGTIDPALAAALLELAKKIP
jgi:hypothetical protein